MPDFGIIINDIFSHLDGIIADFMLIVISNNKIVLVHKRDFEKNCYLIILKTILTVGILKMF